MPVRDILKAFMGNRGAAVPGTLSFPDLNVDQIAGALQLDTRASEYGRANIPGTDSTGPDSVEMDVSAEIEQRARQANDDYLTQLELYDARIQRALLMTNVQTSIDSAGTSALVDFEAQIRDDHNHLHLKREHVLERQSEFESFRRRNGLSRLPKPVGHHDTLARALVVIALVLVESIMNGMFFAEGSQSGLIGGVVQALALATLNVGTAALYALFGLPLLFHRRHGIVWLGVLLALLFAVWLVSLNLFIGHYRDLFVAAEGSVNLSDLWSRVFATPLGFTDARSAILFLLGSGLGVLAVIDVTVRRELYPGFGLVGRLRDAAIEEYSAAKTQILRGLTNLRDQAIDDLKGAIDDLKTAQYELQVAIEGRKRLHTRYCQFLDQLRNTHVRLIQRYRERNTQARSAEAPKYFREMVPRAPFLEHPDLSPLPTIDLTLGDRIAARLEEFIHQVNEAFRRALPALQTVEDLTEHEGRGATP